MNGEAAEVFDCEAGGSTVEEATNVISAFALGWIGVRSVCDVLVE